MKPPFTNARRDRLAAGVSRLLRGTSERKTRSAPPHPMTQRRPFRQLRFAEVVACEQPRTIGSGGQSPRTMIELPHSAAWRHLNARDGFEVVFLRPPSHAYQFDGHSTGVEEGAAWAISYSLELDASWTTRSARVVGHSAQGSSDVQLHRDATGRWRVDGRPAPQLDGCFDVDLETSALTNALPVKRLELEVGQQADAPAAYVRTRDLRVERLEQRYVRLTDDGRRHRYSYHAPQFDVTCVITYDEFGLVLDYPGIATRVS
jgi:hypothetical protein